MVVIDTSGAADLVAPGSNEDRVIQAALRCIARWGVQKTTLDDIAAEARVSRATVYRAFPGGKDVVLTAVMQHELRQFLRDLTARLDACDSLLELCVAGIHGSHEHLAGHGALAFLLEHESDLVLGRLAADRLEPVLSIATVFVTPHLARFIGDEAAVEHAEWVVRTILSYVLSPSPQFDLADRGAVERLATTYFLPVLTPTT